MIQILFLVDKDNYYLEIEGHANFDKYGKDVVCAAFSGMVQMLEIGLQKVLKLKKKIIKEKGRVIVEQIGLHEEKAAVLLDSFFLSCKILEKQFPDSIKIKTEK